MSNHSQQIVQKLWNYCNVLRDDGLSYGDYVVQLTFLLFLKMAHERTQPPFSQLSPIPKSHDWPSLMKRDGNDLETHYRHLLEELGRRPGMLGIIFRKAQNKIQDSAKLRRLIADLIDREQWTSLDADVKGDAYYVPTGRIIATLRTERDCRALAGSLASAWVRGDGSEPCADPAPIFNSYR